MNQESRKSKVECVVPNALSRSRAIGLGDKPIHLPVFLIPFLWLSR